MNRTDFKILTTCSRTYRFLSCKEISTITNLHLTTVNQRLAELCKLGYLKKLKSGKGFKYRYHFFSDHARKFRLFIDSEDVYSLQYLRQKIENFTHKLRNDENILTCIIYGSSLSTNKFRDIDFLVITKQKGIESEFDVFELDLNTFRELYSLGELRLQAALVNGRILIDRDFIFNYFENDLPIAPSEEILIQLELKIEDMTKKIEKTKDLSLAELKTKLSFVLENQAAILFAKNKLPIPSRAVLKRELKMAGFRELEKLMETLERIKTKDNFWKIFYQVKELT